jgi:hypothetical protein
MVCFVYWFLLFSAFDVRICTIAIPVKVGIFVVWPLNVHIQPDFDLIFEQRAIVGDFSVIK